MTDQTRILIVEDDPDGQAVVAHVLEYLSYPIDIADNADEAIAFLTERSGEYRAAIIDLALPGRDGWELLTEIQSIPSTAELPCIALTAYHSSKTREEGLLACFFAYFSKPLEASFFAKELEAIM